MLSLPDHDFISANLQSASAAFIPASADAFFFHLRLILCAAWLWVFILHCLFMHQAFALPASVSASFARLHLFTAMTIFPEPHLQGRLIIPYPMSRKMYSRAPRTDTLAVTWV